MKCHHGKIYSGMTEFYFCQRGLYLSPSRVVWMIHTRSILRPWWKPLDILSRKGRPSTHEGRGVYTWAVLLYFIYVCQDTIMLWTNGAWVQLKNFIEPAIAEARAQKEVLRRRRQVNQHLFDREARSENISAQTTLIALDMETVKHDFRERNKLHGHLPLDVLITKFLCNFRQ